MKNKVFKIILFAIVIVFFGVSVHAYTLTNDSPTENNTDGPITIGSTAQTKSGDLSVNAFQAQKNAWFQGDTTFVGSLFGGTPLTPKDLLFGNTASIVSLFVSGNASVAGKITSPDLALNLTAIPDLCADKNGVFVQCANNDMPVPPQSFQINLQYNFNQVDPSVCHLSFNTYIMHNQFLSGLYEKITNNLYADAMAQALDGCHPDGLPASVTLKNMDTGNNITISTSKNFTTTYFNSVSTAQVLIPNKDGGVYLITAMEANCLNGYNSYFKPGDQIILDNNIPQIGFVILCHPSFMSSSSPTQSVI